MRKINKKDIEFMQRNIQNYIKLTKKSKFVELLILTFLNIFIINMATASPDYEYTLIEKPNQKIHLVKIDLNYYDISLISAHNQVFGREKLSEIAARENADLAINAGFFQIGGNEDGRPTGTLIINGKIFGVRTTKHALFTIRNNIPSIEIWHADEKPIEIEINKNKIIPLKYNKFANNNSIILYSDKWGPNSLTVYKNRNEIIISADKNIIPKDGYILSLPKTQNISFIKINDQINFLQDRYSIFNPKTSAVMGIPFLIMDGVINNNLSNSEKHARTVIGIDKNGKIIIAVVECVYSKPVGSLTLKEVQSIFQKNNISINDWKVSDTKKLLLKELSHTTIAEGMTILEVANFMHEQECISAINFDGGGSSTLYIDGKYINQTFGDKDENEGVKLVRPISDAIIFKKKQ